MNSMISIPEALHIDTDAIPFAENYQAEGLNLKLLQADVEGGIMAVRISFAPGLQLPKHKHTGAVHAFTLSGKWSYLEHVDSPPSVAGSYLYEPPGSAHTLKISDDNTGPTDVFFIVYGAMLFLDDEDNVTYVLDAQSQIQEWTEALKSQGKAVPRFITGGTVKYFE